MVMAIGTVYTMDVGSYLLTTLAWVGVAVCTARPALPARVPALVHTLAFPAILVIFVADLWLSPQLLPAVVRLDLWLLLYRGCSYRARRDDLQIIVMGLFVIVVAGVLTVSLLFAGQILVFTATALAFLLVITIASSTEGDSAPKLAVKDSVPGWALHLSWRRLTSRLWEVANWKLITLGSGLFLGVVAVSAVLFMAIPRFQVENSLFLERFVAHKALTGFSDSIKFGDITEIQQDESVAFDVDVSDHTQAPVTPYWRMVVLDEYSNGGFRMSPGLRAADVMGHERTTANVIGRARNPGAPTWTFYVEPGVSRYLPLLGAFEAVRFREAQNFRFSDYLGILALREEPVSMTAYRAEAMAADSPERPDPTFAARWARNRTSPYGMPLQAGLSAFSAHDRQILSGLVKAIGPWSDGADFGRKASAWLRRVHSYSLSPEIPGGRGDPLIRWMASSSPGHCELFAGALVVAARASGLPARVVTGFKGGTWNAYSGNYTVRNSDAHAWAEVWNAARGVWVRVDPLEPVADEAAAKKGDAALAVLSDRSWAARFNSIRVFWYRSIVNFDQQTQVEAAKAVKDATDSTGKWIRESIAAWLRQAKAYAAAPWGVRKLLRVAEVALVVAAVAWLIATGRWRMGVRRSALADPVRREAGRWLRRVEGPPELVADLQRLRYGPVPSWPRPNEVFRRARRLRNTPRSAAASGKADAKREDVAAR